MANVSKNLFQSAVSHIDGWAQPADVFACISRMPGAVLLESQPGSFGGRYSIICVRPFGKIQTSEGLTTLEINGSITQTEESPFVVLRRVLEENRIDIGSSASFCGGAVGFLGYELHPFTEPGKVSAPDVLGIPDCLLGLYNCSIVFDHQSKSLLLTSCTLPGAPDVAPIESVLSDAVCRVLKGNQEICCADSSDKVCGDFDLISSFSREDYCSAVRQVKEYIAAGDIYQANISQRFTASSKLHPWELYLRLRKTNPAPYAAYINGGDFQIISSSPECFLTLDARSRNVETRPIKGTRPRSADPVQDRLLKSELLGSEKDRAENIMIVDLERNDLGRVCEYGSMRVPDITYVESYPTVHHMVSTVTGTLREDKDAVELLLATFPGGSITGAPKIRAMEIIDELEPVRRGVYTGAIGYIGFDGGVNLNIAIRTATQVEGRYYFHVGAGIVADSQPETEYQETLDKGRAFFEAILHEPLTHDCE